MSTSTRSTLLLEVEGKLTPSTVIPSDSESESESRYLAGNVLFLDEVLKAII